MYRGSAQYGYNKEVFVISKPKHTTIVRVCDAITGVGKTSSAFRYINDHPEKRFLYIAPYLDEDGRVKAACPAAHFIEPKRYPLSIMPYEDESDDTDSGVRMGSKSEDLVKLLREGRNISSTHQLFSRITDEAIEAIRDNRYTLIVDEALETFNLEYVCNGDLDIMRLAGAITVEDDRITITDLGRDLLKGTVYNEYWLKLQGQAISILSSPKSNRPVCGFWTLRSEILNAFEEVFMLTYQFEAQDFYLYCKLAKIPFIYIGVEKDANGFHFAETGSYVPEYTKHLADLIHICDDPKLNSIGDNKNDLSKSWFEGRGAGLISSLANNVRTYTERRGIPIGKPAYKDGTDQKNRRMFTVYKAQRVKFNKMHGWANTWVACTQRGITSLRNRDVLAYLINRFMNTSKKNFLKQLGLDVDEDAFALTSMIQWVWRSAIRDGDPIWIYVPSRRMRTLFENWIKDVAAGNDIQRINDEQRKEIA